MGQHFWIDRLLVGGAALSLVIAILWDPAPDRAETETRAPRVEEEAAAPRRQAPPAAAVAEAPLARPEVALPRPAPGPDVRQEQGMAPTIDRTTSLASEASARWTKRSLEREGGSAATEAAVGAALRWLKQHQSAEGRWDTDGWRAQCSGRPVCPVDEELDDPNDPNVDVGLTALALLAYLGTGQSHRFGQFKRTVNKGLQWLKRQQAADGSLGAQETPSLAHHLAATTALCEAYGVSRDFMIKRYAEKALAFTLAAFPRAERDPSQVAWFLLALQAAEPAGLQVPEAAWSEARERLVRLAAGAGSSPSSGAMIANGLGFLGEGPGGEPLLAVVRASPPRASRPAPYAWHWGTYALQRQGGDPWPAWNSALVTALEQSRVREACADGSWDPVPEPDNPFPGRVGATALNALTLEVYYRFE